MGRGRAVEGRARGPIEGRAQLDLRLGGREPLVLRLQPEAGEHLEHLSSPLISIHLHFLSLFLSLSVHLHCTDAKRTGRKDPRAKTSSNQVHGVLEGGEESWAGAGGEGEWEGARGTVQGLGMRRGCPACVGEGGGGFRRKRRRRRKGDWKGEPRPSWFTWFASPDLETAGRVRPVLLPSLSWKSSLQRAWHSAIISARDVR